MSKLISVVIPYYDEPESTLQYAVGSIAMQVGINWQDYEVILVNDGNPESSVSDEFCKRWPGVCIRKVQQPENQGPGVTRQTGIDNAIGEYVMFIDADDRLQNVGVLGTFSQAIRESHCDLYASQWLEELFENGQFMYLTKQRERTWMFGKAYRRAFLSAAGIRMRPDLRVQEDSYFNECAFALAGNTQFLDFTSYLWKWRDDSTARKNNGEYRFTAIKEYITARMEAVKWLEANHAHRSPETVVALAANIYVAGQDSLFAGRPESERLETEAFLVAEYGQTFRDYRDAFQDEALVEESVRGQVLEGRHGVFRETFPQWCDRIGLLDSSIESLRASAISLESVLSGKVV